jgi:hypothetical protein
MKNISLGFLHQYSKLFIWSFNRKKFEIVSTDEWLWAVNNSRNTFFTILFTFALASFLIIGPAQVFTLQTGINTEFILVCCILQPLLGLIGLRQLLWMVNGRQELAIENKKLTLSKKGTFLTKDKVYDLDSISNIRSAYYEESLSAFDKTQLNISLNRKIFLRHIVGEILFDYKYDKVRVFNDLTDDEKKELIAEIIKRKQQPL